VLNGLDEHRVHLISQLDESGAQGGSSVTELSDYFEGFLDSSDVGL
jgi:hypothetical protein